MTEISGNADSDRPMDPERSSLSVRAEMAAVNRIFEALHELTPESQSKVLRTVVTFFAGAVTDLPSLRSGPTVNGPSLSAVSSQAPNTFSEDRTPTPKEFLLDKKPLQDTERVACLAYYLTHYRRVTSFKTVDLSLLNTEAAQVKLSNAAQAVDNATKAGLLIGGVKGTKQISAIGELYVQALPDRPAAKEAVAHFRQRRRSRKNKSSGSPRDGSQESASGEE